MLTTDGRALGTGIATPQVRWLGHSGPYRLEVAADDGFTDLLTSTQATDGWNAWPAEPLTSRQRVHLRATADGATSTTWVEAGLLEQQDWAAVFIGPADDRGATEPAPSPRIATRFTLPAAPTSARLYVTALGVVDSTINGAAVSDDVLAPGWSAYQHRLAYDTYDVTALLHQGHNELAGLLGDGWYRGSLVWGDRRHRCHYGDQVALLAQLEVRLADGTDVVVATGPDGWTSTTGSVRSADLYDGSATDLTAAELTGGVRVVPTTTELFVRQGPPVRRTEVIASQDTNGRVHDFGQNLAGWVRLTVEGPGTVTVRHAEVLLDGELCTAPLRTAKATDTYVVPAGEHVLEPRFTFHGFRYCEVTGDATVKQVEAVAVHSDLTRTAWFGCSDEGLNRLHENVVWGQRGNFLSVPTDCPQRDERLGWTGDAQVFAATASRLHDSHGFFADWLADLRVEQLDNGSVPVVVPNVLTPGESGIAGWADAACVVPWQVAMRTGDLQVLRDALPSMRAWVDWVTGQLEDGLWLSDIQLGDWLDPDGPPAEPWSAKADRKLVANATWVHSVRLLAQALDLCGEDGSAYAALAEETAERAWQRWGDEARTTQTGCALSLRFGLVPDGLRDEVGADLAALVAANGGRIGTGFLGTPEVLYALSDTGQLEAAYQLLTCHDCPSWLYQVDRGATTTWERWDAILPDGSIHAGQMASSDGGMLSFNHYAYGAVASWMHDVLAGLSVTELPTPSLVIAPRPGGGLTWAEASLQTPRGLASVRWELAEELAITAVVPAGYTARFEPPPGWSGSPAEVEAGERTWVLTRR
jgi:alpha-L-rhamnosidase